MALYRARHLTNVHKCDSLTPQFIADGRKHFPRVSFFISGQSLLRTLVRELVIEPMVSLAKLTQGIRGD